MRASLGLKPLSANNKRADADKALQAAADAKRREEQKQAEADRIAARVKAYVLCFIFFFNSATHCMRKSAAVLLTAAQQLVDVVFLAEGSRRSAARMQTVLPDTA